LKTRFILPVMYYKNILTLIYALKLMII